MQNKQENLEFNLTEFERIVLFTNDIFGSSKAIKLIRKVKNFEELEDAQKEFERIMKLEDGSKYVKFIKAVGMPQDLKI